MHCQALASSAVNQMADSNPRDGSLSRGMDLCAGDTASHGDGGSEIVAVTRGARLSRRSNHGRQRGGRLGKALRHGVQQRARESTWRPRVDARARHHPGQRTPSYLTTGSDQCGDQRLVFSANKVPETADFPVCLSRHTRFAPCTWR